MLPDKKQWKFDTEGLGSFKIKFSSRGKFLAAACTKENSKTIIKILDIETGECRIQMLGHHDLIHDLQWSKDDNWLLSSSADCSVKVWNLSKRESDLAKRLDYTENDDEYHLATLLHPSYVYGAAFFPDNSLEQSERLVLASVCFD